MKKTYQAPDMEVLELDCADVTVASPEDPADAEDDFSNLNL